LRALLLVNYNGKYLQNIKMTVPIDL